MNEIVDRIEELKGMHEDIVLVGEDSQGKIEGKIIKNEDGIFIDFNY